WKQPRLQSGVEVSPLRLRMGRRTERVVSLVGVLFLVLVVVAGLFGVQNGTRNIAPSTVWVVFWLVVPFVSALAGNVYTLLNPWRVVAFGLFPDAEERRDLLRRWGVYPAAVALFAFTWLELVWPDSAQPRTLAVAALVFTAYVVGLAAWAGPGTGLQVGEPFTTYNRVLSAIAPFGRDGDGRLVWRGWLRALPVLPEWPGLSWFVIVMIGTVSYDGLSATSWWRDLLGSASGSIWAETAGMLVIVAAIGGAYLLASWAAVAVTGGEGGLTAGRVGASFAHTLVPIALAYAFAHYFTLVLFEGQLFISTMSDPLGQGWNLFGTADRDVQYWMSPEAVWYVQVGVIVAGHVAGVVLAHDRALVLFSGRH
ncbi:MAG: hypothetical protein GWN32_00225, partial [Gemmatimonadetes bacterium]|nr:hypothetical protein [Gemmatimonadota bacterium]